MIGGYLSDMQWDGNRLRVRGRLSGYTIVPAPEWPGLWRVRSPDGTLSDVVNRTRAKDAAVIMLGRHLKAPTVAASGG